MTDDSLKGGIVEIGIVVNDLEAATPFYTDGLGLHHLVDLDLGPLGVQRRFAHGDAVIKLIEPPEAPELSNPPGGLEGGATGLRYATVAVDDIEGVVARCEQLGAKIPYPIMEWKPGSKVAIVEDFDGNWFEIVVRR
jgi:predicted enzyme related to lactoylglutathione lyase